MKYAVLVALLLSTGCFGGLNRDLIVKHPDAPMLILEIRGGHAKVAVYRREDNTLVEFGWVQIPEGWTLHKYDWEAYRGDR